MQQHLAQLFSAFPEELFFTTRSRQDLTAVWQEHHGTFKAIAAAEAALAQEFALRPGTATVDAFSEAASATVPLHVDGALDNPNWRETLRCSQSQLINRSRAAVTLLRRVCGLDASSRVYVTEQTTPMYRWMTANYPRTVGSEFVDPSLASGTRVDGVRHEDLTRLSFADASIDLLASFDVLEHVPDYEAALREIARVVRPGGHVLMTFPFTGQDATIVRAAGCDRRGRASAPARVPRRSGAPRRWHPLLLPLRLRHLGRASASRVSRRERPLVLVVGARKPRRNSVLRARGAVSAAPQPPSKLTCGTATIATCASSS